jgi:hypothetical protein
VLLGSVLVWWDSDDGQGAARPLPEESFTSQTLDELISLLHITWIELTMRFDQRTIRVTHTLYQILQTRLTTKGQNGTFM